MYLHQLSGTIIIAAHLLHHFFDARRLDASVLDQLFHGQTRDLAANPVERRERHHLRRVIDNEIHPGMRLERLDIAAIFADDAAFHVFAGKLDHGGRRLGGVGGRVSHDREAHKPLRFLVG